MTGGFWAPLLTFLNSAVDAGFLRSDNRALVSDAADVDSVLRQMADALAAITKPPMAALTRP